MKLFEWEEKLIQLLGQVRIMDDCISRAQDGLENIHTEEPSALLYCTGQLDRAGDHATNAKIVLMELVQVMLTMDARFKRSAGFDDGTIYHVKEGRN